MTAREIEVVKWLLARCDRDERQSIAGLALLAALQTYPPEQRPQARDEMLGELRARLETTP